MGFKEDIIAARQKPRRHADLNIDINGTRYKFRFRQMDGVAYSEETLRHPPDMEIGFDREYGYNLNSLTRAVAPLCGVRVEGDEEIPLQVDPLGQEDRVDEWADLFAIADGGAVQSIASTIFQLNEFATSKAVRAAKKVLDGSLGISP